jgi:D-xylose 1-dehydrogenase
VGFVDIDEAASKALGAKIAAAGHPEPLFARCDVRDIPAYQAAITGMAARLGPFTVLINNAARDDRHAFTDVTQDYWDESLAVNLRHHFFAAQTVAPGMTRGGGGSIINLGSVSWMRGIAGFAAYSTSKAAINGLTRTLARELGVHNIRVNAIVPGAIVTERQKALWLTPEKEQGFLDAQCLKFRLSEDDVARAALFLASDEARGITGQNLIVDAGLAQTSG